MTATHPESRSSLCDTPREEFASAITHGAGVVASILALVFMIQVAKDGWSLAGGITFGTTLILLYLASTLYHSVSGERLKSFFQVLDHVGIYLLIAGSYTPVALVSLRGLLGWGVFGLIWSLAITGIGVEVMGKGERARVWSTAFYLGMGWVAVFILGPIIQALPTPGFLLLVAGGLLYSVGVVFYVWRTLPFNHAIWHLFVMGGSACHAVMVVLYILR